MDHKQVGQKIKRLAYQILENSYEEKEVILAGINTNGLGFAKLIHRELTEIGQIKVQLTQIKLNPAAPLSDPIEIGKSPDELTGKVVIVVDDVANTGRTIFYAIKPLLDILPKKVEAAVLVDRQHKSFPIRVDYVGLSLATTLNENIDVHLQDPKNMEVYLTD
jgi:pyrimidine operon attenuation protein/uracil phosphoribosyltransferase